ncbi:dTDP-4-dehydrorhamnose reductase [Cloacibacillus sp. An23]|uniref:dTDP-4-dehydrorhamnose reductase n=1 Tax=Cloacibacillus sp. An23 TaxID=1965591 RepID=UPI000B396E79|nr:dTDP-4-dehydrorhamnose reductase [Cloacibacillus sp. An23]OUO91581.1 dTDP-4-dehydrorhamnose reductase [Cloacibacillus sp. An23]
MDETKKSRILIFGKNGQVGWELCRTLSTLGEIRAVDIDECDLTDKASIINTLDAYKPSVIANAAAYTAVDRAETERGLAFKLNADAPGIMADWAAKHDALMTHYSTDYVFDGTKKEPWTEDDKPNPLNVYGESKLAGDLNIQSSGCKHLIFRTSWVYGARGKNFYLTMRKMLREKDEIRVVNDQYGAPTWCRTIAEATAQALAQVQSPLCSADMRKISGVYNLTNSGVTTWYGFANAIKDMLKVHEHISTTILPITSEQYRSVALRPYLSALSHHKLYETFMLRLLDWDISLKQVL